MCARLLELANGRNLFDWLRRTALFPGCAVCCTAGAGSSVDQRSSNVTNAFAIFIRVEFAADNCIQHPYRFDLIEMPTSPNDSCPSAPFAFYLLNSYLRTVCPRNCINVHAHQLLACNDVHYSGFASAKTSFERCRVCFARLISPFFLCRLEKQLFSLKRVKLKDKNFARSGE